MATLRELIRIGDFGKLIAAQVDPAPRVCVHWCNERPVAKFRANRARGTSADHLLSNFFVSKLRAPGPCAMARTKNGNKLHTLPFPIFEVLFL